MYTYITHGVLDKDACSYYIKFVYDDVSERLVMGLKYLYCQEKVGGVMGIICINLLSCVNSHNRLHHLYVYVFFSHRWILKRMNSNKMVGTLSVRICIYEYFICLNIYLFLIIIHFI